jgi:uncharacterized membrane protein HdeD (DUF308 family)
MAQQLTPEEVQAGDVLSSSLEKVWGWYLAMGIISIIFGMVILTWRDETLYAVTIFAAILFLGVGAFRLVDAFFDESHRLYSAIIGIISIGVGIAILVWPKPTLYIVAILIAWVIMLWGITELVVAFANVHAAYWWLRMIFGILAFGLAFWVLRYPGHTLNVLVAVLGIWAILYGALEIIGAFAARHARAHWEAIKAGV